MIDQFARGQVTVIDEACAEYTERGDVACEHSQGISCSLMCLVELVQS